jgi:hypothetical protein
MKVYENEDGSKRLVGRAEVPDDVGPVLEIPLFGAASVIVERYTIATVTHSLPGGQISVERAVLLSRGQPPDLLPRWQPLAS